MDAGLPSEERESQTCLATLDEAYLLDLRETLDDDRSFSLFMEKALLDLSGCVDALGRASGQDRDGEVARLAHGIKGVAASLGLMETSNLAADLERQVMAGNGVKSEVVSSLISMCSSGADLVARYRARVCPE